MNTYTVSPDGKGKFQVIVTGPSGKGGEVVEVFTSEAKAESWAAHKRVVEASEAQLRASGRGPV